MPDIADYIYGEDYAQRNQAFADEISRIEDKHLDFFKNRKPGNETDAHDRLQNHFAVRTAGGQVSFKFNQGTDLPENIKQECVAAFHQIWKYE